MKKSLGYDFQKSNQEISLFVEQLPTKLKVEVNLFIHEERYKNIKFFAEKSNNFLSWTCPLLCPVLSMPHSYLYLEGDQAQCLFFMTRGECCFVLPAYNNAQYISVGLGSMFGLIDIHGSAQKF